MKSLTELERDAYLAGATVTAGLYAGLIDSLTQESERNEVLDSKLVTRLMELDDLYEEFDELSRENYELRGRLEEAEWRLLEKENE